MLIDTLTPLEQKLIERFIREITGLGEIESIYLFGSRARGGGGLESDVDIAVVVKERSKIKDLTRRAIDLSLRIEEELNIQGELQLSPIVIEESLLSEKLGIGRRITEEGILLWSGKLQRRKKRGI